MIINTEVRDLIINGQPSKDQYGRCRKELCVSYVDYDKRTKMFNWTIPDNMMYCWKYATKKEDIPDAQFKSWDFKPVTKSTLSRNFTEQRIHEILIDIQNWWPDNPMIKAMNELNIPNMMYMDIEVDVDDNGFPEADTAKNPINTVSICVDDTIYVLGLANLTQEEINWIQKEITSHCERFETDYKFVYRYHSNEYSLLNDLIYFINQSDCVTGWNWFGYDYPYIYNRLKNLSMDPNSMSPTRTMVPYRPQNAKSKEDTLKLPAHRAMFDYLEVYKKWDRMVSPKESNKLDWVAERVLGVKKVQHTLGFKDMWEKQKKEYVFYNAIDSILVRELDLVLKTSQALFALANLMHCPMLYAFSSTKSIEIVQAEYLYKMGRVFPSGVKNEKEKKGYEGAFVYEPVPGVYKNLLTLDYASLYPTTIRQFNISPDTLLCKDKNHVRKDNEIKCCNGCVYTKDFEGFIPKILTDFYGKRKMYKKEMIIAEKEKNYLEDILKRRLNETKV